MKHIQTLSRMPQPGQQQDTSLAAIFALVADILAAIAIAVTAKENQDLPDLTGLLGGGGGEEP